MTGTAGGIAVHKARALHYSPASKKPDTTAAFVELLTSSDAKPYTAHPQPTRNSYQMIRGEHMVWVEHNSRPSQVPPNRSGGCSSIYSVQSGEDKTAGSMMWAFAKRHGEQSRKVFGR